GWPGGGPNGGPGGGKGRFPARPGRGTGAGGGGKGSEAGRRGARGCPHAGVGAGAALAGPCIPGSGTAPLPPICLPVAAERAGCGFAAGGAPVPGSGTFCPAALPSPGLGRCTVNGVLHFGHLIDRPDGGTRPSSSSYAAGQLGHWIRIDLAPLLRRTRIAA